MIRRGILVAAVIPLALHAATYYVDADAGKDANSGASPATAWKTLDKVNTTAFSPGDRILLRSGSVWREQLAPKSSGREGAPIIIDRYGKGPPPRIDAGGKVEDAVRLFNVEQIEVRHLEITNHGPAPAVRRGVHVFLDNFGVGKHIVVYGLYIHDVNGTNQHKDNGGIIFRTNGDKRPSRFDGLTIERNIVWKVDRSAIAAQSYHWPRTRWYPSLNVVIRDNYVDDVGGDGIVPWATDAALIEHNIARNCNRRANTYNAGIWPWSTDNSLLQLNEASWTRTTLDGQGFDSDYNSRGTTFQYNYSHDNEGGFLLICTPGKRDPRENLGNLGTVVRYNISRNDRERIFHLSAAEKTLVENNAIYVGPGLGVQMLLVSNWNGWPDGAVFRNNDFYAEGTARYGHEVGRSKDGTYRMAPGWGPGRNIVFESNRYYGNHLDSPEDARSVAQRPVVAPNLDWNGPEFDPSKPDRFERFLREHRRWMLRLFEKQFGKVTLAKPQRFER
ncbi:MAG TPA: right-handed parallel beta-helix repeat-containing protein [Bryobacteraceae bacterium]|nr:right-handed parallel beta-helix repeat-containing protein [Bryobacteraceae bacterium]